MNPPESCGNFQLVVRHPGKKLDFIQCYMGHCRKEGDIYIKFALRYPLPYHTFRSQRQFVQGLKTKKLGKFGFCSVMAVVYDMCSSFIRVQDDSTTKLYNLMRCQI